MPSRAKLLIMAGTIVVLGLVAWLTARHLYRGEHSARSVAATLIEANARGIENALNRQLLQAESVLASLPMLFSSREVTPEIASDTLRGIKLHAYFFRDVMLVAPSGTIWASSLGPMGMGYYGLDPATFIVAKVTTPALLIGPIRDRSTGDWSIYLARRVAVPGQGDMVAVAEMSVTSFASLIAEVKLDVDAKIVIEKQTGEVVVSLPHDDQVLGIVTSPAAGSLGTLNRTFSLLDSDAGHETLAVVRKSPVGDLYVSLTSDVDVALAEWHLERRRILAGAGAAILLVVLVATMLFLLLLQSERLAAERARAAALLEDAIEGMADGFVIWDERDRLVSCNEVYRSLYRISRHLFVPGVSFEDIIRRGAEAGQYPVAEGRIDAFVAETVAWHKTGVGSLERLLPDGRWLFIRERRMANGWSVGSRTDITVMKKAQADLAAATEAANRGAEAAHEQNQLLQERDTALRTQNMLFEAALNNMSHGLLMVDGSGHMIVANPRFADLFGIDRSMLVPGMTSRELMAAARGTGVLDPRALVEMRQHQSRLALSQGSGTFVSTAPSGRVIAVTQRPLEAGGCIALYEDVTAQRETERRVSFLAHHDDLTKLPNRAKFRSEIDRHLARMPRGGQFALLYLDLDRFKGINDTFGHATGDALLKEVAARLQDCAEGNLVARLGGDEFAIIRQGAADFEALSAFAQRIIGALTAPFDLWGRSLSIGVSIGIAPVVGQDLDREALLRNADLALYEAKSTGRCRSCIFDPVLDQTRSNRVRLERDLREAIAQDAFTIAYQPIFDLQSDRISGFEALLRWNHPERGPISPAEFVPVAEEMGLINTIGAWVLQTACREIAQLPGQVKIAVNLSTHQLRSDIVQTVADALRASGLQPSRLELEITETALLTDQANSEDILLRLSALGTSIALDDFGTGYSSLSHLRNFPLSKIKIDKSFVREMTSNRQSAAIVTAVVDLAAELGMTTTAEGIETDAQLRAIRAAGCTQGQGYLLGRPASILHAVQSLRSVPQELMESRRRSA